jgi:epoxyqueuosine reductase
MSTSLAERIRQKAQELGFNRLGITPATPSPTLNAYLHWVENNLHGDMTYLARPDRLERRQDLRVILPEVRSLIIVALDYTTLHPPNALLNDPTRGRISNYAWGADYHAVMLPRLEALAEFVHALLPENHQRIWRAYADTGAILERSHAQQAGLGFIGKNPMLIHPRAGSYFFLGEILTTLDFGILPDGDGYDPPHRDTMCGTCTRCLTACPTAAFPAPYVLDARRCISYLTIELKHDIPPTLRPLMGNWVYGCDICQAVCPWNRFAVQALESSFYPVSWDSLAPPLVDLLSLKEADFAERFAHSSILRIKRERLVRNACVAAGNSGQREFIPLLRHLLEDASPLIQRHAAWAIDHLTPE